MNFLCRKWTTGINLRVLFIPLFSWYVRQQGFLYQQLSLYIGYHISLRRLTKCTLTLTINSSFWFHYNFLLYLLGIWAFLKNSYTPSLSQLFPYPPPASFLLIWCLVFLSMAMSCSNIFGCAAFHWSMINFSGTTLLENSYPSSLSS